MHDVRCYDYVDQPFAKVRDALHADALGIFTRATEMATERAESLRHILRPHDPTTPVTIRVSWTEEVPSVVGRPTTKLAFECRAKDHPEAFPIMMATLSTHALTPSETQLEVFGSYVPAIADRPVDKRIAEASVLAFVREVATCLREDLGSPTVH